VGVCVCSLIARERMYRFAPNLVWLFLEIRKRTLAVQNSENILSSIPGEGVSCSSKTKHDRRMAPKRMSRRGYYRNKEQNSENMSWVRFPVKMLSVAWILSKTEERRQDQSCLFRRGEKETNATTTKTVLGSSPDGEILCSSKLSTREERRLGKICWFRRGAYRN
jgi:hypothetical protein